MDRYIERKGLPLNDQERSIIQDFQSTLYKQGGTAFLATTTAIYLLCRKLKATKIRSSITGIATGLMPLSIVSIRQYPHTFERIMTELPVHSELRVSAYNSMLEYNPQLSDYVVNKIHQKKLAEESGEKTI